MADIDMFEFPEFRGVDIQVPRSMQNRETFVLNIRECLQHIRRFPSGDILLNQIKYARPQAVSPRNAQSEETRSLKFGISTMVVIVPMAVEYVQSGYLMFGGMVPSSNPQHNPVGRFYRRGGASTEALDLDAAGMIGVGSKAVIRFSNAIMPSGINTPPFIILAHELIHAQHYLFGVRHDPSIVEENRTMGVGKYDTYLRPLVSENQIRREAGLPIRIAYSR